MQAPRTPCCPVAGRREVCNTLPVPSKPSTLGDPECCSFDHRHGFLERASDAHMLHGAAGSPPPAAGKPAPIQERPANSFQAVEMV